MLELDLATGEGKGEREVEDPGVAILRANNRFLYCGDTSGKVRDRSSYQDARIKIYQLGMAKERMRWKIQV